MTKFGEIQLRECPFCGKDPDEPFFDAVDYGNTAAFIRCSRCNMEMSEDVEYGDGDVQTMIRLAIRWNTRAKNITPASQLGGWVIDDGNNGNGRRD